MSTPIPPELRPAGALESAPVALAIQGGQHVEQLLHNADDLIGRFGMIQVNPQLAQLLHGLGLQYETFGVLKSTRGSSVINQHALLNAVVLMNNAITKEENAERKSKLVYALGYVADKLAKVTALMNRSEEEHRIATDAAQPQRRSSFIPGSVVNSNPGTIIHATNVQVVGQPEKAS